MDERITPEYRAEVVRRLRGIDSDAGGFVKALADAVGMDWNGMCMSTRLGRLKNRLADLIESAPRMDANGTCPDDDATCPNAGAKELADKIRKCSAPVTYDDGATSTVGTHGWFCRLRDAVGLAYDTGIVATGEALASAIERVAAPEMDACPWPLDRDGVPVKPGDVLYDASGNGYTVYCMAVYADDIWVTVVDPEGERGCVMPSEYAHVRPRTLEDVLEDFDRAYRSNDVGHRYALMRCRVREAYGLGVEAGKGER